MQLDCYLFDFSVEPVIIEENQQRNRIDWLTVLIVSYLKFFQFSYFISDIDFNHVGAKYTASGAQKRKRK